MGTTRFVSVAPGRRGAELILTDARRIALGTNDAEALVQAITTALELYRRICVR